MNPELMPDLGKFKTGSGSGTDHSGSATLHLTMLVPGGTVNSIREPVGVIRRVPVRYH